VAECSECRYFWADFDGDPIGFCCWEPGELKRIEPIRPACRCFEEATARLLGNTHFCDHTEAYCREHKGEPGCVAEDDDSLAGGYWRDKMITVRDWVGAKERRAQHRRD
jgi:hypothetical protein